MAKILNLKLNFGDCTGTYRFETEFYGCMDMSAKFERALDITLAPLENTLFLGHHFNFNSNAKVNSGEHEEEFDSCLEALDRENFLINLTKCHFLKLFILKIGV